MGVLILDKYFTALAEFGVVIHHTKKALDNSFSMNKSRRNIPLLQHQRSELYDLCLDPTKSLPIEEADRAIFDFVAKWAGFLNNAQGSSVDAIRKMHTIACSPAWDQVILRMHMPLFGNALHHRSHDPSTLITLFEMFGIPNPKMYRGECPHRAIADARRTAILYKSLLSEHFLPLFYLIPNQERDFHMWYWEEWKLPVETVYEIVQNLPKNKFGVCLPRTEFESKCLQLHYYFLHETTKMQQKTYFLQLLLSNQTG